MLRFAFCNLLQITKVCLSLQSSNYRLTYVTYNYYRPASTGTASYQVCCTDNTSVRSLSRELGNYAPPLLQPLVLSTDIVVDKVPVC